jgi:hypothetical protein
MTKQLKNEREENYLTEKTSKSTEGFSNVLFFIELGLRKKKLYPSPHAKMVQLKYRRWGKEIIRWVEISTKSLGLLIEIGPSNSNRQPINLQRMKLHDDLISYLKRAESVILVLDLLT